MAAPLPPEMENKSERLSRRLSSLSAGTLGFIFGTVFGVAFSSMIIATISGLGLFVTVGALVGAYWYLARKKANKRKT